MKINRGYDSHFKVYWIGAVEAKADLSLAGNGYELPAFSQATNSKGFRCHKSEALKGS